MGRISLSEKLEDYNETVQVLQRLKVNELKELANNNKIKLEKTGWLSGTQPVSSKDDIIDVLANSKFREKDLVELLGLKRLLNNELLNLMNSKQLRALAKECGVPLQLESLFGTRTATSKKDMVEVLGSLNSSRIRKYAEEISLIGKTRKQKVNKNEKKPSKEVKTKVAKPKKLSKTAVERKILRELRSFKPVPRGKFKEKNFENQLLIWLTARGFENVDYQVQCKQGRVDIVIDRKYAIELKLVSSPSALTSLIGQVFSYAKEYEKVFLIIYDVKGSIRPANIEELKTNFQTMNALNIEVIEKP